MADTYALIQQWRTGTKAEQVAACLARAISTGRLTRWNDLPPTRRTAAEHDVSASTVRRAKAILARHGILVREAGRYYAA